MALKFKHRGDGLLQENVAKVNDDLAPDSYIAKYTVPIHKALLAFLDEHIIGKEFESNEQLTEVLATWEQYLRDNTDIQDDHIIREWRLYFGVNGWICAATDGPGGDFHAAQLIEEETDEAQVPEDAKEIIKEVFGREFKFFPAGIPELNLDPYWMTTKGNPVFVFPPKGTRSGWAYWAPTAGAQSFVVLAGDDQADRAFSVAIGFSEQQVNR